MPPREMAAHLFIIFAFGRPLGLLKLCDRTIRRMALLSSTMAAIASRVGGNRPLLSSSALTCRASAPDRLLPSPSILRVFAANCAADRTGPMSFSPSELMCVEVTAHKAAKRRNALGVSKSSLSAR